MARFNVPPCDPDWDYATQWELLHGMRNKIQEIIKEMALYEKASQELNQLIHEEIQTVISTGTACINLTDFHPSNSIEN